MVVAGFKRIRVVDWLHDDPYPMAEVEDYPDSEIDSLVDVEPAMCSLRRVFALASELGSDVSGIELELADDPLAASYQLAACARSTPSTRSGCWKRVEPPSASIWLEPCSTTGRNC